MGVSLRRTVVRSTWLLFRASLVASLVASMMASMLASVTVTARAQHDGIDPIHHEFYLALQAGQYARADELVADVRRQGAVGSTADMLVEMLARRALERQQWDEAMAVPDSSLSLPSRVAALFSRGLAAARSAWPGGVGPAAAVAQRAAQRLARLAQAEGPTGRAEAARATVLAAIAAAQEERDELALLLTHALEVEAASADDSLIPPLPLPLQEVAGDLWLQVDRYLEAQAAYRAAVTRYPSRGRSWLGLARASAKAGDRPQAVEAYQRFLEAWAEADEGLVEVEEARGYLGG